MMIPYSPIRIVLVGATGFVGSAVLRRLSARARGGGAIRALARRGGRQPVGAARVVQGHLPDAVPAELFPSEPYVIVHLGTKQRGTDFDVNPQGTDALLSAANDACAGIIYGSSLSVCGQGPHAEIDESAPVHPETALARSRASTEQIVFDHGQQRGICALALRPRFILGRGDRDTLPALSRLMLRRIRVGNGRQLFSIISVDDYATIIWRLVERIGSGDVLPSGPLCVGYQDPLSFNDIASALADRFELAPPRWRIPTTLASVLRAVPLQRARSLRTKLQLIGRSQFMDTSRLGALVGQEIVGRDPMRVLAQAVRELPQTPPQRQETGHGAEVYRHS